MEDDLPHSNDSVEIEITPRLFLRKGASPQGYEIAFTSTDNQGNSGPLNEFVLRELGADSSKIAKEGLEQGYTTALINGTILVYVVTVDVYGSIDTKTLLERNLGEAIRVPNYPQLKPPVSAWVPLMGTGAGGQSFQASAKTTAKILAAALERDHAGQDFRSITVSVPETTSADDFQKATEAFYQATTVPNKVWILQYRPGDRITRQTGSAMPGSTLYWKTEKALPRAMTAGDPVIYWRTIDPDDKDDRGGLAGIGRVLSVEAVEEDGTLRFPTEVIHFDEGDLIGRDEVIRSAGITRKIWRGAVLGISSAEAYLINNLLINLGRKSFLPNVFGNRPEARGDVTRIAIRRDDAERDHDTLGRSSLAVFLSWMLHEIWCSEQGLLPFPPRKPKDDAPGFVAHIDAPWGGGKTSFANLIARTLNPTLDGTEGSPQFLTDLYPDRDDKSGVFISSAHRKGELLDESGNDIWHEDARRPWIIVSFNAWLNQHVDPPWWSFYQTIRKSCFASICQTGIPTVIQNRDGSYSTHEETLFVRLARLSKLWFHEILWRFWTPAVRNATLCLLFTVAATLVLQQFDLFDLSALKADVSLPVEGTKQEPSGDQIKDSNFSLATFVSTTIVVLLGGASALWSLFATFTRSLLPGTPEAVRNYSLGSADPISRFRRHFSNMLTRIRRPVLVIIDDIDRCEPEFIVEMARGLQTILTSPRVVFLLLGDRNWIEQAFEVCHEDMKEIDVGPEHTFGGRFVEKAIQLSFILPSVGEYKDDYVREVLNGRETDSRRADAQASPNGAPAGDITKTAPTPDAVSSPSSLGPEGYVDFEISAERRLELRRIASKADTVEEIDATAEDLASGASGQQSRADRRAMREEVVLRRAAQKTEVELAISHRLQPLAAYLPSNPRHIKRIINAISIYQSSIYLAEDDVETRFGQLKWRQLVIGVVLMIGYPKSWSLLAKRPHWADYLIAEHKDLRKVPDASDSTTEEDAAEYTVLSNNRNVVDLLSKTKLREDVDGAPIDTKIDQAAVRWLQGMIPMA